MKIYNVKSQRRQLFKLWLNIMYAKIFAKMSHVRKILSKFLIDVQNKMLIFIFFLKQSRMSIKNNEKQINIVEWNNKFQRDFLSIWTMIRKLWLFDDVLIFVRKWRISIHHEFKFSLPAFTNVQFSQPFLSECLTLAHINILIRYLHLIQRKYFCILTYC